MPKSRKKKEKKADFQKVKLKVGKRKARGDNVTNTAFKTASINITEQLKETTDPSNKRNLTLKDLLCQLNHYNVTIRHEALCGILDLFKTHPDVMHSKVSVWLVKILEKLSDTDPAVRHALVNCVRFTFSNLENNEVLPFFKAVIVHVCCGMTHINEGVQLDALEILDLLLTKFPETFLQYQNKVLTNFLDLISKQSSKETSASQTLKCTKVKSREIHSNINGAISSLQGRKLILEKLYKILKVICNAKFKDLQKAQANAGTLGSVIVVENSPFYKHLYKYSHQPPQCDSADIETWLEMKNCAESKSSQQDMGNAFHLTAVVLPILISCWVEFDPGQLASGLVDSNILRNVLPGMKSVINTVDVLMKLLWPHACSDIQQFFTDNAETLRDFQTHCVAHFFLPMKSSTTKNTLKSTSKEKHTSSDSFQQFCIEFNFIIARILCNLLQTKNEGSMTSAQKNRNIAKLNNFIAEILKLSEVLQAEFILQVVEIIYDVLTLSNNAEFDAAPILKKMCGIFKKASDGSHWKISLIRFFSKLLKNNATQNFLNRELCEEQISLFIHAVASELWMLSSADRVDKSVKFMRSVLVMRVVDDRAMSGVVNTLIKMTECAGGLFMRLTSTTQRSVVEMLYSLPLVSVDLLANLSRVCHTTTIDVQVRRYILTIVALCLQKRSLGREQFISFILSVVIGYSMKELQNLNAKHPNTMSWNILSTFENQRTDDISEHAIGQLVNLDERTELWDCILPAVAKLLASIRSIPLSVSAALVKLLNRLCEYRSPSSSTTAELNQVADLLSSSWLYLRNNNNTKMVSHQCLTEEFSHQCVQLMASHPDIHQQLVKKWMHTLREYSADSVCVKSIVEALLGLFDEPLLRSTMKNLKPQLQKLSKAFITPEASVQSDPVLHAFHMQISVL